MRGSSGLCHVLAIAGCQANAGGTLFVRRRAAWAGYRIISTVPPLRLLAATGVRAYDQGLNGLPFLQGRIKSLYSMQRKMKRKGVPPSEIFDARALRLVVDDADGDQLEAAIAACYKLMPAVHRLWRPINGECDDYITQPKVGAERASPVAQLKASCVVERCTGATIGLLRIQPQLRLNMLVDT